MISIFLSTFLFSYNLYNYFLANLYYQLIYWTHHHLILLHLQLEQQQNNVYLDVKTAYLSFVNARDGVPVAKQAMEQAQVQYEIAAGRYRTGLSDAIELKDAEITYRNAQLNYYNTLMQYNTAVASVEKTVGMPIKPSKTEGEIDVPVDVNEEEINL